MTGGPIPRLPINGINYDTSSASNPTAPQGNKHHIHRMIPSLTVRYKIPSSHFILKSFSRIRSWFCLQPIMTEKVAIISPPNTPPGITRITDIVAHQLRSNQAPRARYDRDRLLHVYVPGQLVGLKGNLLGTDQTATATTPPQPLTVDLPISIERTQEIEDFYTACLKDPISDSLTDGDKRFLKEVLIPNLLTAKYALMEWRGGDRRDSFIMTEVDGSPLINFRDLVQGAHDSGRLAANSYFYQLRLLETSSTNTFHQHNSRTPMSVKIYPDGTIKFVIPLRRSMGSFKKVSHIIHSHVDTPGDFTQKIKLSSHRDLSHERYLRTQIDMGREYKIAQALKLSNFDPTSQVTTERVQLFATPQTPLWDLVQPLPAPQKLLSVDQVVEKVDQLFEVAIELLQQINKIGERGYVHGDINVTNILVEKRIRDDGSEHLVPFITDFGFTTQVDTRRKGGTEGYYLTGQHNSLTSREMDLYALGKTFDALLGLLFNNPKDPGSFKYDLSLLPIEERVFVTSYIRMLHEKFCAVNKRMYATTTDRNGAEHYSNNTPYSGLITAFSGLKDFIKNTIKGRSEHPEYLNHQTIANILEGLPMPPISELLNLQGPDEPLADKFKKLHKFLDCAKAYLTIPNISHTSVTQLEMTAQAAFIREIFMAHQAALHAQLDSLFTSDPEKALSTIDSDIASLRDLLTSFEKNFSLFNPEFVEQVKNALAALINRR